MKNYFPAFTWPLSLAQSCHALTYSWHCPVCFMGTRAVLAITACAAEASSPSYNEAIKNARLLPDGLSLRRGRAGERGWAAAEACRAGDAFKGCCCASLKAIPERLAQPRRWNLSFFRKLSPRSIFFISPVMWEHAAICHWAAAHMDTHA